MKGRPSRSPFFYIFVSMKRLFLLFALLCFVTASAQVTTASIGGRITDDNGPIEGVTVVAIHQPTNTQYYATTGRGGWYQMLDVLPGGPYTVRIHYFSYNPLTVRNLLTYAGENMVVDADLEAGTTEVHRDEAATSLRLGEALGGGSVAVSPLDFNLVAQEIDTPVPFDVREEATLTGENRLRMTPTGTGRFHGSAFGYYYGGFPSAGSKGIFGLTMSTPISSEDYLMYAGLQYGPSGLNGTARFDARLGGTNRLDLTGGRLDGMDSWAAAGFTTQLGDGAASNRAQAGWYGSPMDRQLVFSDDFTVAAGSQRLLVGVRAAHQNMTAIDSSATQGDVYVQDVIRLGRRMTLQAGLRFSFPFAFSPRVSLRYDLLGDGAFVLRAGTAVYGVHGEGSVWKNLAAVDTRLPGEFYLTLEGIYGQSWKRPFYISRRNIIDSHYALTARLERPLADRLWALASYTRSDGFYKDRIYGGFSYKALYLTRMATTVSVLYRGSHYVGNDEFSSYYPAPEIDVWQHSVEARVSQDLGIGDGGHVLQATGYVRHIVNSRSYSGNGTWILAGLRYSL